LNFKKLSFQEINTLTFKTHKRSRKQYKHLYFPLLL